MKTLVSLFTIALFAASATLCLSQQVLDNNGILKLEKAGLGDDLIVSTINGQPGHYSLSADDIVALKQAGLSDRVIGAMVAKNGAPATAVAAASSPAPVAGDVPAAINDVGVYYRDGKGNWQEVVAEVVNWKTGGVLKSLATDGIVKGDVNGNVRGASSPLAVSAPVELIVRTAEGNQVGEYQLLHLHPHSHDREFRSVTGGVFHASGGAQRDDLQFESKKIGSRTYEITLPVTLEKGEYGLLPPGEGVASNRNIASSGKIYTFKVE